MAASSDFRFRELRLPDDADALLALLRLGFPETIDQPENTAAFLAWKFPSDAGQAFSELGFMDLADASARLVSFYGAIAVRYTIDGRQRTIGLVCDVMSHPEVRRRGLFVAAGASALGRLERSAVDAVIGFPIRDDVMPGHLKVGWSTHVRLPVYVCATGAPVPGSAAQSGAARAASILPRLCGLTRSTATSTVSYLDADDLARSEIVAELDEACAGANVNLARRSPSFLRWRLARPGATYMCATARGRAGAAYVIARRTSLRGVPALAIVDLLSSDRSATRDLLASLWRDARRSGAALMAFCANPATARRLRLARYGFVRSPLSFRLIARPTGGVVSREAFDDDARWHLTWLDADTV